MSEKKTIRGAEFLITETDANDIFIPEEWNEEQKMIAQMCNDFLAAEVHPHLEAIDKAEDTSLMPSIMDKAGELGLLGMSVPEELGGMGKILKLLCLQLRLSELDIHFLLPMERIQESELYRFYTMAQRNKKPNIFPNWLLENGKLPIV